MKKLFFTVLGLTQILIVSDALAQHGPQDPRKKAKTLSKQVSAKILNMQSAQQLLGKGGDQPLTTERRVIGQDFFEGSTTSPIYSIKYGYVGNNYGMQFDKSFLFGFPEYINGIGVNQIIFDYGFYTQAEEASVFAFRNTLGVNVLADTIIVDEEGETIRKMTAQRNADLSIQNLFVEEFYNGNSDYISKTENVYTNNLLTEINTYEGDNLSNLELAGKRKITYNSANNQVATDSTIYYYNGAIDWYDVSQYTYNGSGKLIKLKYIDSEYPDDTAIINFTYYSSGLLQQSLVQIYEDGLVYSTIQDSIGYNSNDFVNYKKSKSDDEFDPTQQIFEFKFDGNNRLDSLKMDMYYDGDLEGSAYGKYKYSIDNNPDSLSLFDPNDANNQAKILFYYQNFNTTSTKTLTKNKDGFNIFPNPISGNQFNVYCKNDLKNKNAQITVVDVKGSKIFSTSQPLSKGSNAINIPTVLAPGTYIVEIIADQSSFTQQFIKL